MKQFYQTSHPIEKQIATIPLAHHRARPDGAAAKSTDYETIQGNKRITHDRAKRKSSYERQIYNQMKLKDTEELLAIWRENDREAWTDEAFEQIRLLLKERLGDVPAQDEADDDSEALAEEVDRRALGLTRTFKLAYWLKVASWIVVGYTVVQIGMRGYYFLGQINSANAAPLSLQFIIDIVTNLVNSGFLYLILLAFAEILYLLEDIHWVMNPVTSDPDVF